MKVSSSILLCLLLGTYLESSHGGGDSFSTVNISYTLWINDEVSKIFALNLESPEGSIFEQVMNQAAAQDPNFVYEFQQFTFGKFITKIGEFANIPSSNKYWMIFELPSEPNPAAKPSDEFLTPVGVSSLVVKDGHHYLFWLKTVHF